ncbi:hypothetical protein A3D42_02050 [Candidatus Nomurabacteria bacterium RIFCSPHIGHO2_02_FULL_41_18]|uniref:Uncharacterized protein n=1 Tax=Candidatus Nomurabacteria bacterium RIFCSPHIGHO2_02_FULL_41_18 TaxID=1801754 RepID=A0A1F6W6K1_9BACT|nr:MAG: hypothetical protein A2737_00615 [Candidatus Nomurabacteria bacterium RIFCSPHIGHO2_01_FULL_41_71]OGI77315.1 MAG: hypothetical protein A3D42_02050 [Candidatus Nomurabacteria bacterium RIFCSPHIGHO2_02_FULL_41_18]OGI89713.1 MAG: hypothetical protein A3B01_02775 [Candidatus Nomurabacteria bacterium RIFCSPLOWO2_01_FULL_41_52b]OGJ00213.1 MAG: hypothetical protein A3I90_01385 [Candidatus Nomurabacteria bacterium RIFCSPLOWO2_02_FULL_41_9]
METTPGAQETKEQKYIRILTEINTLVASALKVLAIQPGTARAEGKPKQFKNNFFILFLALRSASEGHTELYLKQAQKLGEKWTNFLAQNKNLISKMDPTLNALEINQKIVENTLELMRLDEPKAFTDIAKIQSESEKIRNAAWATLNPLLEEAANKMRECGIVPEKDFEFFVDPKDLS